MPQNTTEKLIEKVKGYPFIYQPQHEHYSSMKLKEETWTKIARELGYQNGDEARDQWKKLRDCHRDALRRQRKRNNKGISTVKKWMYQREMSFLIPFMGKRTTAGERDSHKYEDDTDFQAGESQMDPREDVEDSSREVPEEPPTAVSFDSQVQKRIPDTLVPTPLRSYAQYSDRRDGEDACKLAGLPQENHVDPLSVGAVRENYVDPRSVGVVRENHVDPRSIGAVRENHEDNRLQGVPRENHEDNRLVGLSRENQEDELYHFFMSMYFSTGRLPGRLRCKVKRAIFEAVTQAEEENLLGGDPLGELG